jgi:small-conductance mechanosensitive channel
MSERDNRHKVGINPVLYLVAIAMILVAILYACAGGRWQDTTAPTATPQTQATSVITPTATGQDQEPEAVSAAALDEVVAAPTATEQDQEREKESTDPLDEVVVTRAPEPTATPDRIQQTVDSLARRAGMTRTVFLGLSVADWINVVISALFILIAYLVGTWLILRVLRALVRRTPTRLDDRLLREFGGEVRWLIVLLALNWGTQRLTFVSAETKALLGDVYFVIGAVIAFRIVWQGIGLAERWYRRRAAEAGREEELSAAITLLVRLGQALVVLLGLTIVLSNFGINIAALATVLGVGGLAVSLAAQDTIGDAIAGFIILADQPFRIGDRIEIQGVDTWGDVVEIGMRTTKIRTRDNRMVIVPNSIIGKNQVINYTYPDPRYRIETHVNVAYGTDIEIVRRVITHAVRQVDDVLPDRPVDVLYLEMGDWAMVFRVRWWIETYADTRRVIDRVHTALQGALDEAGIESPYPTSNVLLEREGQTARPDKDKPEMENANDNSSRAP